MSLEALGVKQKEKLCEALAGSLKDFMSVVSIYVNYFFNKYIYIYIYKNIYSLYNEVFEYKIDTHINTYIISFQLFIYTYKDSSYHIYKYLYIYLSTFVSQELMPSQTCCTIQHPQEPHEQELYKPTSFRAQVSAKRDVQRLR